MTQEHEDNVIEGEVVNEQSEGNAGLAMLPDTGLRPVDLGQLQTWADTRQKALAILMEVAIASTRAADWSDQGGKPYPEQGACSAIIGLVGITITPPKLEKEYFEDELGRYYIYFLESEVTVPKFGIGPLPIIGRASSRDQFFAWRTIDGVKQLRPQSEVDPGDIKSKAYTNLRYRAVKAAVPEIAGMTWERLTELTGGKVARGKVRQIHYGDAGEVPEGVGNCPTCGKGTLVEKSGVTKSGPNKDKPYHFWACSEGRYDSKTKKRSGCQHIQNEPPEQPDTKPADESASESAAETSSEPNKAAVAVLEIVEAQGHDTKGKKMATLGRACKGLEMAMPRGSDPLAWLSTLSDEDLGRLTTALDAKPAEVAG